MKQLLILVLFFLSPIFIFAEDLEENNECRKFYKLKLQDNKYFRYKPKQIIGYPNEETFESTWHIDCKNSKVFSTGGIFEREYTLEKHRYDSNSKVYLVDMLGEEEGDIHKYTLPATHEHKRIPCSPRVDAQIPRVYFAEIRA